jgi:UDP-N-acetylmuramate--alanine ligase
MFEEKNKFHFVGVGGIGMSSLAKFLFMEGKKVSGSDILESESLDDLREKGLQICVGHKSEMVDENVDMLVYSTAVPEDNVERSRARELGVPELSRAEFLGEISKMYSTVVVTGTHGKSTTTAMLGLMLEAGGLDPTVLVGSFVSSFKEKNLRVGKSKLFVVEGCEYQANMLKLHPEMIVLTNIEKDHLDYYRDLDHIKETFATFIGSLTNAGKLIYNANDKVTSELLVDDGIGFGIDGGEYSGSDREVVSGEQVFEMKKKGELLGKIKMVLPGEHNVMNALAATTAAMELGVTFETCQKVLESFYGIWRRFERIGKFNGADVISDYGHHPTAIESTVQGAREFFPKKRIVLCFQPHQHSRTKELLEDFVLTLKLADETVVAEIYGVAGRSEEDQVSSKDIVEKVLENDGYAQIEYAENFKAAEEILKKVVKKKDVLIIMGAGDIDEFARGLVKE